MGPAGVLAPPEEEAGRQAALPNSSGAHPGLVAGPCLSERLGWQGRRSGTAGFPKVAWDLRRGGRGRG